MTMCYHIVDVKVHGTYIDGLGRSAASPACW